MTRPQFVYVSYINTTPQKLWDALTRGEFTKKYWFGRRIESDWHKGSPVRFYDGDSDVLTDDGVVLESDPPRSRFIVAIARPAESYTVWVIRF